MQVELRAMTPAGIDAEHPQAVALHISPPDQDAMYLVVLVVGGREIVRERASQRALTGTISKLLTIAALRVQGASLWAKVTAQRR